MRQGSRRVAGIPASRAGRGALTFVGESSLGEGTVGKRLFWLPWLTSWPLVPLFPLLRGTSFRTSAPSPSLLSLERLSRLL